MSGPHRLHYSVMGWGLSDGRNRAMKCWSENEGLRALTKKSKKKKQSYRVSNFVENNPPERSYGYTSRAGHWAGEVVAPSRKQAQRRVRELNQTLPFGPGYRLDPNPKPIEERYSMERNVWPDTSSFGLAPPRALVEVKTITTTKLSDLVTKAAAHDLADIHDVRPGDSILVRYPVTHVGIPGAVCGSKIPSRDGRPGTVLAFTEADIVTIERAPRAPDLKRGDLVKFAPGFRSTGRLYRVQHVEDGYATIQSIDTTIMKPVPQSVPVDRLEIVP